MQLSNFLEEKGIKCIKHNSDADTLIIEHAVKLRNARENIVIITEDIDLWILLNSVAKHNCEIYFFKLGKGTEGSEAH